MLPAMVMAVAMHPGPATTAAATTRGPWCHTTALTATTHGPIPAIHPAFTPRPASPRSLALPRITPAAVIQLLPPDITSTIRPVTPAVAFPALPFPLAAAPITPAAVRTIQAALPAALGAVASAAAPRTTPVAASEVAWVAHPQEAPASAAAPTTAATHQAVALPVTPAAGSTAAAATMACIEARGGLQDMKSNQCPEIFSGRFVCSPGSAHIKPC